jgi:hypothetical protein
MNLDDVIAEFGGVNQQTVPLISYEHPDQLYALTKLIASLEEELPVLSLPSCGTSSHKSKPIIDYFSF